jgi:hypothetical protein
VPNTESFAQYGFDGAYSTAGGPALISTSPGVWHSVAAPSTEVHEIRLSGCAKAAGAAPIAVAAAAATNSGRKRRFVHIAR